MQRKPSRAEKGTLKKVLRLVGRCRWLILLSALFALVSAALTLAIPRLVGEAIDLIAGAGQVDFSALGGVFFRIAACALGLFLSGWLMNALNNRVAYQTVRALREQAFERIERLPLSYLDAHPVGETVSRVITDVDQFADGLLLGFSQLFTGVVTIAGTLVFMLLTEWRIALLVVLLTPLSLFIARFISRRTYSMFKKQSEVRAEQTALIDEMIGSAGVVRAFSYEERAQKRFDAVNDRLAAYSLKAIFFSSLTNPTTRFVNSVIYAAVALVGGLFCIGGAALTVGGLASLLSYVSHYTKPFNEISGVIAEFQNALACASRIFSLIEEPTETPDAPGELSGVSGGVTLDGVCFSYDKEKKLIEDLTLRVGAGQRIAIVGPTGCGKTTLINLLMRFYDVDAGAVSVDGRDVREVTRHSLRRHYGMVLQETWLKGTTVRENIRMGRPGASDGEVVAAAKASHAHAFILRLEKGYDTVLGEDGGSLSQGQKQLLCIARVMLSLPPMLILDEATSSIDTRTEKKIQEAFERLMQGRTSFIVAHRLSTVRSADRILVMNGGRIVEQGTHGELLARGGFYASLYRSQFAH